MEITWNLTKDELPDNSRMVLNQDGEMVFFLNDKWYIKTQPSIGTLTMAPEAWCEIPKYTKE